MSSLSLSETVASPIAHIPQWRCERSSRNLITTRGLNASQLIDWIRIFHERQKLVLEVKIFVTTDFRGDYLLLTQLARQAQPLPLAQSWLLQRTTVDDVFAVQYGAAVA